MFSRLPDFSDRKIPRFSRLQDLQGLQDRNIPRFARLQDLKILNFKIGFCVKIAARSRLKMPVNPTLGIKKRSSSNCSRSRSCCSCGSGSRGSGSSASSSSRRRSEQNQVFVALWTS